MKPNGACLIGLLAGLAWVTGCGPGKKPTVEFVPVVTEAAEESRSQFRKMAAISQVTAVEENRKEFVAASEHKLAELDEKTANLTRQSENYKDEAKAKADQALEALKSRRAQLKQDLEEFKTTEGSKEARAALDTAMNDLEKAFDSAKTAFE